MKVLIIGGGHAGCSVAVELAKKPPKEIHLEIFIIDPKDYFEVKVAALRAWFDDKIREMAVKKYDEFLPKFNIKHIQGKVKSLSNTQAILEDAETFDFDICLVSVGASCPTIGVDPSKMDLENRVIELQSVGEEILNKNVLIVGGGTVGAEVAGELEYYGGDDRGEMTVVQQSSGLCPQMSLKGQNLVMKKMEKAGVKVFLDSKAMEGDSGKWIISNEENTEDSSLTPEKVIICTGFRPRNEFMDEDLLVDEKGWIKIDEYYRVNGGNGTVFAFGDCTSTGKKSLMDIMTNVTVLYKNMKSTLEYLSKEKSREENGINELKLAKAGSPPPITLLTLGPNDGVFDNPLFATSWLFPRSKNNDMFIGSAMSSFK